MLPTLPQHPFIDFKVRPDVLDPKSWMLLGEAMSKAQHLAGHPLKPETAAEMLSVTLAKGVQATTAIEGNTLSDDEVKSIVEKGTANVGDSRAYLEREVQNVLSAIREIDQALSQGRRLPITSQRLCELNFKVLDGVPDEDWVVPGEFRQTDVVVGPYKAPHWTEVPALVDEFVLWLKTLRSSITPDSPVEDRFYVAVLSAIMAHLYIAWIHPFGNGNGRTARLIEMQILSESGIVPIVASNVMSDYYNKTRNLYYLELNRAQQDPAHFVRYAIRGFVDELRAQINDVRKANLAIHWESYVYEAFKKMPNTDARARQRELALCLPIDKWVTPEEVTLLTPSLARRYALAGDRTSARDLNDLFKHKLVYKDRRKYLVRREVIEAFIPPVSQ